MYIDLTCPGCGTTFQAPDRLAGRRIRCLSCRQEFHVAEDWSDGDDCEPPQVLRPATKLTWAPWLIAGAVVGHIVVVAGFVCLGFWLDGAPPPAAPPPPQPPRVQVRHVERPPIAPQAVVPRFIVTPPRPPGRSGRPAQPAEGPIVLALSNPRRVESMMPDRRAYQVDYQIQGDLSRTADRYYLVCKLSAGVGEANLRSLDLANEQKGTITFAFFPGYDPGQEFEMWVEREQLLKPTHRQKISKPVTLN